MGPPGRPRMIKRLTALLMSYENERKPVFWVFDALMNLSRNRWLNRPGFAGAVQVVRIVII